MNKVYGIALKALAGVATVAVLAGSAQAADLAVAEPAVVAEVPSMIDVAFGVAGATDYVFRGISQTKSDPAIQGYAELQVSGFYAGVWASNVNFPTFTDPSSEIDFYAGYRATFDAFTVDAGGLYYYYPGELRGLRETDYWEIYAKPSFAFGDLGSITGNLYWTSDFLNTGANAAYLSGIAKVNVPLTLAPDVGVYVSGEFGKQWIKRSTDLGSGNNFNAPDYLTWNVGAGLTYKAITLDVRYSDTDLKKGECIGYTGFSKSCDERIVAKISFDTALSKLK